MGQPDIAADRLRDLQRITDAGLAYLPLADLLAELLNRAVGVLSADTAALLLLDDDGKMLVPRAVKGLEEELRRGIRIPVGRGFAGRVAGRGEAVRIVDLEHAEIVNPLLREKGLKSLLGVPLIVEGDVIGVLHVGSLVERMFTDDDVELLQLIADRAALAIYGRLAEQERGLADALQRSLIPTLPDVPGIGIAGRYLPAASAKLGGDWYDAFPLPAGRVGMAIGDVVGRGFRAAALMAQLKSGLRAYALDGASPREVLGRLSRLLRELGPGRSATVLYMVVDPQDGQVAIATAGHPPPLIVDEKGGAIFPTLRGSVPLGSVRSPRYDQAELCLQPGSMIVLYTDGLIERSDESLDSGFDRLTGAVREAARNPDSICDTIVDSLLPDGPLNDDAAVLVAQSVPLANPLVLELAADIDAIPLLRRVIGRWLAEAGASRSEVEDVALAFSEACANAAEHAYSPAEGTIEIKATVSDAGVAVVSVRDFGSWRAPRGEHRGRGLVLMEGLMDTVDVIRDDEGTTVQLSRQLKERAA